VTKGKRAALYLRVSTDGQTVENQRRVLEAVAERRGWAIVATYEDAGISGAKGRDSRPGFNAMLSAATRRRFDVLLFWSIDRLGRSTAMVATALAELEAAGVAIYADKEAVDATTPHGRAMLQMAAVFGELERAMIRERVIAGLARAKAESPEQRRRQGKKAIGRPRISANVEAEIRDQLELGLGILKVAKKSGVGVGTVHRIKRTMISAHAEATVQPQE
jgi:DNA invertase Pin-like site-specific DNA recombinase